MSRVGSSLLVSLLFVCGSVAHGDEAEVPLFQPNDYPERLAAYVCPFDVRSPHSENPHYLVTRYDDVEIFAQRTVAPLNADVLIGDLGKSKEILFTFDEFEPYKVPAVPRTYRTFVDLRNAWERPCVLMEKGGAKNSYDACLQIGVKKDGVTVWELDDSNSVATSDTVSVRFVLSLKTFAVAISTDSGLQPDLEITKPLTRTRLPAVAFDANDNQQGLTWARLQIRVGPARTPVDFRLDLLNFRPGITAWCVFEDALRRAVESSSIGSDVTLTIQLLPRWSSYAIPGDRIELHRMENEGFSDGSFTGPRQTAPKQEREQKVQADIRQPRVWQYSLVVDPDGFVWIPPVTASGDFFDFATPIELRRQSERDSAFFRFRLWTTEASQRFPVEELVVGLSGDGAAFNGRSISGPCRAAMCDGHIFENTRPGASALSNVRYHLQIAELTWTMVVDGERATIPFRRGYRIDSALTDAYRQVKHRSVDFRRSRFRVVVVPSKDRNPSANDTPFRMDFHPGGQPNPDDAIVLPGDIVFVY